jgi:thiamine transporter
MALPGADASNLTALMGGGASGRCWVMPAKGEVIVSTPLVHPTDAPDARARLNLNPAHWGVRALVEIAVAVALAAVLSYVAQAFPLRMPQGGSFGLEMLPILFIALRRGVVPGVVAGGLFGLLQLVGFGGAPYIYHPLQAALDYPLAFAALGLAGLVPVGELKGAGGVARLAGAVAVGAAARLACHFFSGLIFFAEYAPKWEAPWLYSITYNLLYLLPSAVVTALVLWPVLRAYDAAFPDPRRIVA